MKDLKDPSFSNWLSHRAGGGVRVFFVGGGGPHLMILMVETGGQSLLEKSGGVHSSC